MKMVDKHARLLCQSVPVHLGVVAVLPWTNGVCSFDKSENQENETISR